MVYPCVLFCKVVHDQNSAQRCRGMAWGLTHHCFVAFDSGGKGYGPAIQTLPCRDANCVGFRALFMHNTDTQAGAGLDELEG